MDYKPSPLLQIPVAVLKNGKLPDADALDYQGKNYQKYHELAFDYSLLLRVAKGEALTDDELKRLKK